MSREIKFRAWDKKQKAFINGFNMIGFSTGQGAPNKKLQRFSDYWDLEDVELMQYTGLKDKNRKEIYEGDVIPYHFNRITVGTVKYGEYHNPFDSDNHGGHIGFYLEWNDENSLLRVDLGYWIKVSEIIGNTHENPELVNQPST
jgi:uncharacterized phage protein (TIGR01671 family)